MNKRLLELAMSEATIFLALSQEAYQRLTTDKYASISGSKETAACKRASMDLTRALAELRR